MTLNNLLQKFTSHRNRKQLNKISLAERFVWMHKLFSWFYKSVNKVLNEIKTIRRDVGFDNMDLENVRIWLDSLLKDLIDEKNIHKQSEETLTLMIWTWFGLVLMAYQPLYVT